MNDLNNEDWCEQMAQHQKPTDCRCCDPTDDSPDPVVVRLEREVERLHSATETVNEAFNELFAFKDAQISQLQDQLVSERSGMAKVIDQRDEAREQANKYRNALQADLDAIRAVIHAHNPLMSDGPLAYRVLQLCNDLIATRKERDEAREASSWLFNDDNGHTTEEEIFTRWPWLEESND